MNSVLKQKPKAQFGDKATLTVLIPYAAYNVMATLLKSTTDMPILAELQLGVGKGDGTTTAASYTDTKLEDDEAKAKSSKALTAANIEITELNGQTTMEITVDIGKGEFNRDDTSPIYCEAGLFFKDSAIYARATYNGITKTKDDEFQSIFTIKFA